MPFSWSEDRGVVGQQTRLMSAGASLRAGIPWVVRDKQVLGRVTAIRLDYRETPREECRDLRYFFRTEH